MLLLQSSGGTDKNACKIKEYKDSMNIKSKPKAGKVASSLHYFYTRYNGTLQPHDIVSPSYF
jgi:hypothetical protein